QAAGKVDEIGPPADIYALGAILYCLLTGRPPFQAANPLDTLLQVLDKAPIDPRQLNPHVPRDLETICLKCLQKEPHRRYSTASDRPSTLVRRPNWHARRRNPRARMPNGNAMPQNAACMSPI